MADRLKDTLRGLERPPKVFILRMRRVPAIDATGMHALDEFFVKCHRQNTHLLLAGVHAQPIFAMTRYGLKVCGAHGGYAAAARMGLRKPSRKYLIWGDYYRSLRQRRP